MTRPVLAADVTVVIPTVGRPLLQDCLRSIAAADPAPAEIIVVDQSASDEVARWVAAVRAEGLPARHLPSRETGIANATNRGLERARTPFVAVTHDDCRVTPSWLAGLLSRLRAGGDVIVTGRVEPAGEGAVPTVVLAAEPTVHTRPRLDGDDLFPPNMAFPRSVLDRIGYLDEHPSLRLAGEDNDWAYRALRAGIPIVYEPSSVVAHVAWQPAAALPAIYRRYARGQGAFYGKHLRRGDLFIARRLARDLLRAGWLALRASGSRNPELRAMAHGEVGLLPGLLAGLRNPGDAVRVRPEGVVHR
ncbi:MAG TPA: glycosyltransferase [Mycobacteriales bacterium]|nr:glycosyltransferase [Mycobacteriales bacterium]